MLGLTGFGDLRDIKAKAEKGNENCILALAMNAYRTQKYIGAYTAAMNGLDAIVFTTGIGENSYVQTWISLELIWIKLKTKQNPEIYTK